MGRFENVNNVDIIYKPVAPQINVTWNPQNDKGSVMFFVEHQEFHKISGQEELQFIRNEADDRFQFRPMGVQLATILNDNFEIVLPDGSTVQVSGQLLMYAFKAAFEKYYAQKLEELRNLPPIEQPVTGGNVVPPEEAA